MPDEEDLENEEEVETPQQVESGVIRDLRRELKAAKKEAAAKTELEQELAAMRRATQMREAVAGLGVKDEAKFAKLADKFIEGEPKEEDLRALAEEYGFITETDQAPNAGEAQQMRQMAGAHVGATTPMVSPEDYAQRMKEAKTAEEVIELAEQAGIMKSIQ